MKNIKKIADDIEKNWDGPTGKVWCKEEQKFVDPDTCGKKCPECEALKSQDMHNYRYLHLTDDYKSY
jgi:Zn finger protein HypA/HybF involved in hydrogenase expression